MGTTTDCFLTVATLAIEHNPQALAAVKEITAREWGEPGLDLDRPWRVGGAVTDALHLSIGHPGGDEPEDVRWEYTILLNLIYHVSDKELGEWCIKKFNPHTGHWKAYVAQDGHYPQETKCFADGDDAVLYLANELAGRQATHMERLKDGPAKKDRDEYWRLDQEYSDGYEGMGEHFFTITSGLDDPTNWVGCGPAVLIVGYDYVIEGCDGADCTVKEASQ